MTQAKKREKKLLRRPKDMTPQELCTILESNGFKNRGGKGSHTVYKRGSDSISIPMKPKTVGLYLIDEVIELLGLE